MMERVWKYLIVDDDEISRLTVEVEAGKYSFLQLIASCAHPLEAIELMNRFQPDILFVDIEMPDISGLELVKQTRMNRSLPIFITSHPEFALDGYELEAFDYLIKPLTGDRFAKCALRIRDYFELREKAFAFDKEQESDFIIIKQGYEKHRLRLQDIAYLEAMKDYTRVIAGGKQYLVLSTLTGMLEKLAPEKFVRVHRSFAVNVDKITEVSGSRIFLGSADLPVGKMYKKALTGKF
jgi:DNA-binding LytR/AlgR family response regulator